MVAEPQARQGCDMGLRPATSPPAPAESKECHFFKLPPELREIIYEEVLSTVDFLQDQGPQPRLVRPSLLATCKSIQAEALPLYTNRVGMLLVESTSGAASYMMEFAELLQQTRGDTHAERRLMYALSRQLQKTHGYLRECDELALQELYDIREAFGSTTTGLGLSHKTITALTESLKELATASDALAREGNL
ncbi:hypothetical protein PRZ48_012577 [Zasmidium cellare]|uniref:Uncharacterized protein n=1 Tax=Zasmidium cellare TaxID=395010 RepID=A0ABR0E5A6_ZASCE|nr:hypothetical protein PRZ48_012577 [Zasmidium cellare]